MGSAKPCRQVTCHSELRLCSGAGMKRNFSWCQCPDKTVGESEVEGWDGAIRDCVSRMGTFRLEPSSKGKRNVVMLPAKHCNSTYLLLTHIHVLTHSAFSRDAGLNIFPWSIQAACSCTHPSAHEGCAARAQLPVSSPASFVTLGKLYRIGSTKESEANSLSLFLWLPWSLSALSVQTSLVSCQSQEHWVPCNESHICQRGGWGISVKCWCQGCFMSNSKVSALNSGMVTS